MSPADGPFGRRRVRMAFEQVYDEIRQAILTGRLAGGERLPTEASLAEQFGVGRPTVREALRLLGADGLIRTAKGSGGGSFVTLPTIEHVSRSLERNFELLSISNRISLPEFVQAWSLIEVFAAREAALARTAEDVELLRATLERTSVVETTLEHRQRNWEFHSILLRMCGNALLQMSAHSIWFVLDSHLRDELPEVSGQASDDHAAILQAIEVGDGDLTAQLMQSHVLRLGQHYDQIWDGQGRRDGRVLPLYSA
jgi:GntR family transcriptional repressor for pyruvate dehydrogenase complex